MHISIVKMLKPNVSKLSSPTAFEECDKYFAFPFKWVPNYQGCCSSHTEIRDKNMRDLSGRDTAAVWSVSSKLFCSLSSLVQVLSKQELHHFYFFLDCLIHYRLHSWETAFVFYLKVSQSSFGPLSYLQPCGVPPVLFLYCHIFQTTLIP